MAEPRVHLGSYYEIDVCTFEPTSEDESASQLAPGLERGQAPLQLQAILLEPTLTLDAEFPEQYAS